MRLLLSPAVGLMHRLALRTKFALVGLLLALPPALQAGGRWLPAGWDTFLDGASLALVCCGLYLFVALYRATAHTAGELLRTVRRLAEGDLVVRAAVD
ncbi:MAG: hypothetical protein HYZ18_02295, partial [Pseudogulbenkiania sp.]|nr:hypothetical protein [Pseudogulbenkiania sp.]